MLLSVPWRCHPWCCPLLLLLLQDTADFSIADGDNPRWLFLSDSRRLRKRVQEKYGDMVSNTVTL